MLLYKSLLRSRVVKCALSYCTGEMVSWGTLMCVLQGKVWSPSSFIAELGKEINNPQSVYYWAYKVNANWFLKEAVATVIVLLE